jgi:DNA repair exonuclease SbcCD ATPase subunit
MKKLRIKVKKPWIGYPGSTLQQNYGESLTHGYLLWDVFHQNSYDVEFRDLPNPCPYVTIEWLGNVSSTLKSASTYPANSRFRIRHKDHLTHRDTISLTTSLKRDFGASEVTFKNDHQHLTENIMTSGKTSVLKNDLRQPEVLLRLLKEYYSDVKIPEDEWQTALEHIRLYIGNLEDDGVIRNTSWSIKHVKFDNLFCYGENNVINFQNLNGIVGVFGPNRSGKSSLPGTLMYSLFNSSDRGSIKNLHICNARKPYCYSRIVLSVNGIDYAVERQTTKNENKRGEINASTALNFYRVDDGVELTDLAGEQRTDTDKTIKKHIGTLDDFVLTSLSAQGEINQIIELGSSKRNQLLSRFLDLDVFYKIHDLARNDLNVTKAMLKQLPDRDWQKLEEEKKQIIVDSDLRISELSMLLVDAHDKLNIARNELAKHRDVVPVSKFQVEQQQSRVTTLTSQVNDLTRKIELNKSEIQKISSKIKTIEELKVSYDLDELRKRQESFRKLDSSITTMKHNLSKENNTLKQQKRSLKILNDVPCGDQYPTCTFIKDAHENKEGMTQRQEKIDSISVALSKAELAFQELKIEDIAGKIKKLEDLNQHMSSLSLKLSDLRVEVARNESLLMQCSSNLTSATLRLSELTEAIKNDENIEVVELRNQIDSLQRSISLFDQEKLDLATKRGRAVQAIENLNLEHNDRTKILQRTKVYDLIVNAFSKRGIPSVVISDRLPIINAEIAKILSGIVDFTLELEKIDDSELEIFLNYGDSRRIIELGSGMEKAISSIALRVALINVSSLPKTDMFIIDEGFGVFDDAGVEACNRLLLSLKRYFKSIIIITHIDGIKDVVDHIIEITKSEKDSQVRYE